MAAVLKRQITTYGFPGVTNGDPRSSDIWKRPYHGIEALARKTRPGCIEYVALINTSGAIVKQTLFVLQGMERGLDTRGVEQWEELMRKHDVHVVLHNYPGYGNDKLRGIKCDEQKLKDDCLELLMEMKTWEWCKNTEIVLLGNSIGTGPAMWLASETQSQNLGIKKIVLISAYTSLWALVILWGVFFFFRSFRLFVRPPFLGSPHMLRFLQHPRSDPFPSLHLAASLKDVEILVIHGENDDTVPASHGKALFKALSANPNIRAQPCFIPFADHRYTRPIAEDVIFSFIGGDAAAFQAALANLQHKATEFLVDKEDKKKQQQSRGERRADEMAD